MNTSTAYLRKKIEKKLVNITDYDRDNIKSEIDKIMNLSSSKSLISNYEIVCDDTNNSPTDKCIKVDLYIQPINNTATFVNNIIIAPDENLMRIHKLKKERIRKLEKLNKL